MPLNIFLLHAKTQTSWQKKGEHFEQFLVDERLDAVDKALFLLTSGSAVQRAYVFENLDKIFMENKEKATAKILRFFIVRYTCNVLRHLHVLQDNLWRDSKEQQILIGSHISKVLEFVPVKDLLDCYNFVKQMLAIKDAQVTNTWEGVLVDLIAVMPTEVITPEVLKYCVSKGNLSESEKSRTLSCRLYGSLAKRLDAYVVFLVLIL